MLTKKAIIVLVIIVVIVAGIFYWRNGQSISPSMQESNAPIDLSTISKTDTSNVSLNKDMSAIDSQLNALDTDASNIDQGLNDQPIPQQ